MLKRIVKIGDKEVPFKASACTPLMYRSKFGRDFFIDLNRMSSSSGSEGEMADVESLEIFEKVAYIMALQADPSIPPTLEEWLDQYNMLDIYSALEDLIDLWGINTKTTVDAPKNAEAPQES